jgi:hypothetical protein
LAAMLSGAAPGVSAELKDPLSRLTSAGGSILCFGRDYSRTIWRGLRSK